MENNYRLPGDELDKIFKRDSVCVYCRKKMALHNELSPRRDWYTIEHLNYLPPWNNPATVTICCWGCNSSRGAKKIVDWFKSTYCISRGITEKTVSQEVKNYIRDIESKESAGILYNRYNP